MVYIGILVFLTKLLTSNYLKLNSLELATWGMRGGGGKFWQHASCASAHITFAALPGGPWAGGGGGVLVLKHVKKCAPCASYKVDELQRNVEMK